MLKKRAVRKEIIFSKIKRITDTLEIIEENFPDNFEDFKNSRMVRDAVYKEMEFCIENILDICNIINSDLNLGTPETEESIIKNLKINKVFNEKIITIIEEMKKFRNILVHKYGEIDDRLAYDTVKEGLKDFELIIKEIEKFLKGN